LKVQNLLVDALLLVHHDLLVVGGKIHHGHAICGISEINVIDLIIHRVVKSMALVGAVCLQESVLSCILIQLQGV
jgi:hypothetical protein